MLFKEFNIIIEIVYFLKDTIEVVKIKEKR